MNEERTSWFRNEARLDCNRQLHFFLHHAKVVVHPHKLLHTQTYFVLCGGEGRKEGKEEEEEEEEEKIYYCVSFVWSSM